MKMRIRISAGTVRVLLLVSLLASLSTAHAWYSPSEQRWVNRDPSGELGFQVLRRGQGLKNDGPNLYRFVANDPLRVIDPLGLKEVKTPQDCWETVEDFYCGSMSGFPKKCCQKLLDALFRIFPRLKVAACEVQWDKCIKCCSLEFQDDDEKKDICESNCYFQQARCIAKEIKGQT